MDVNETRQLLCGVLDIKSEVKLSLQIKGLKGKILSPSGVAMHSRKPSNDGLASGKMRILYVTIINDRSKKIFYKLGNT